MFHLTDQTCAIQQGMPFRCGELNTDASIQHEMMIVGFVRVHGKTLGIKVMQYRASQVWRDAEFPAIVQMVGGW
jgi:hypothetical protein